jgi:hypothetical protein
MQSSRPYILTYVVFVGLLALASIAVSIRLRPTRHSSVAFTAAIFPALLMLASFYSLAIHLHYHLGGWPTGIGDNGFPRALIVHEQFSEFYFIILMLGTIFVWPVIYVLCAAIRRWRVCLYYLGVYALSFLLCSGAMLLAPRPFWDWWLD